jgi:hypothetical protein
MTQTTATATDTARLILPDGEIELPIIRGTEGEAALDIRRLRGETARARSRSSTARRASCATAATRSSSSRTAAASWRWRGCC